MRLFGESWRQHAVSDSERIVRRGLRGGRGEGLRLGTVLVSSRPPAPDRAALEHLAMNAR
jgi:hypothetical protein